MPVHNAEIADIFEQVADLLEIDGANPFRVRAYREAASTIGRLSRSAADMVAEGEDLSELSGIGEDLAGKIEEIVETGSLAQLDDLEERVPPELANLLNISGLGPKRVQTLYQELEITTRQELAQAARQEKIRELSGFGQKLEHEILEDIERSQGQEERILLAVAEQMAEPLADYLGQHAAAETVTVAGSYRRCKETVGDLDIVASSQEPEALIDYFVAYEDVEEIVSQGDTRSTILLRAGLQVDLRVVEPESYGAALFYLTGSRAHNLALRNMALERGLKINEYGVYEEEERLASQTEADIYAVFDLPYIPPELREERGELDAAREGNLPPLVTRADLQGNLHGHTTASDGRASLAEMAQAARERGLAYLAITDHSPQVTIAQGLDADGLADQLDEIDRLNEELDEVRLLKSMEVDILKDGSLGMNDEMLARLDVVLCSVHSHFDLGREAQTERLMRAMDNPHVNILAHPTGRMIGDRPAYELDMERLMEAALARGCYLELNAQPNRLDLNDIHCQMAKELGLKISIAADAHATTDLDYLRFGIGQARRGWLAAGDVLNTRPWPELKELLARN